MLRIHLILMQIRIRILDPHWNKMTRIQIISLNLRIFFNQKNYFQIICFIFFVYFYPETWWTIQKWGNFIISLFFKSLDFGFRSKKVFLQFFVDILPLGSGSVDPTYPDPDPKHWLKCFFSYGSLSLFCYHTYYLFCTALIRKKR